MSSIYSLEISQQDGKKVFKCSGDLVINHIDKMTTEIKDALAQPTDVSLVIDNPNNVDMTFLQLVVAIRHSCQQAEKNFEVHSTIKDDLKELVVKAGLSKELNI